MRLVGTANQQHGTGLFSVMTVWVDQVLKESWEAKHSKRSLWRLRSEKQCLRGLIDLEWGGGTDDEASIGDFGDG